MGEFENYLSWNQVDDIWNSSNNNWLWNAVFILLYIGGKNSNVDDDTLSLKTRYILIEFLYNEFKKSYKKDLSKNNNKKVLLTEINLDLNKEENENSSKKNISVQIELN